jgi:hypothetical protein
MSDESPETRNPGYEAEEDYIEMFPDYVGQADAYAGGDSEIEMPPDSLNPVAAAREAKVDAWENLALYGADPHPDLDALADAADAATLAEAAYKATSAIDDAVQQLPKNDAEAATMNAGAAARDAYASYDALNDAVSPAYDAWAAANAAVEAAHANHDAGDAAALAEGAEAANSKVLLGTNAAAREAYDVSAHADAAYEATLWMQGVTAAAAREAAAADAAHADADVLDAAGVDVADNAAEDALRAAGEDTTEGTEDVVNDLNDHFDDTF